MTAMPTAPITNESPYQQRCKNLLLLGQNQLIGDMLCLGGAVLFAIVTVLQELSVKNTDIVEYLGLLGLFGSILSGVQMLVSQFVDVQKLIRHFRVILEKQTLITSTWRSSSALLSSFSACQFMFCTFSSIFLINMGTTALHLSLLSGNFYTLIVGILRLNYKFHALYFLSYTLSMTGVYIYAIKQTPVASRSMPSNHVAQLNNSTNR
jgi:solute carrier family 35 protein F1/2